MMAVLSGWPGQTRQVVADVETEKFSNFGKDATASDPPGPTPVLAGSARLSPQVPTTSPTSRRCMNVTLFLSWDAVCSAGVGLLGAWESNRQSRIGKKSGAGLCEASWKYRVFGIV